MVSTSALIALAVLGGLAHVIVTIVWYRPQGGIPVPTIPVLEAGIFGVSFGLIYVLLGMAFRAVARWRPPFSEYLLLVVSLLGLVLVAAVVTERVGESRPIGERSMSIILAGMIWVLPLFVVIL